MTVSDSSFLSVH